MYNTLNMLFMHSTMLFMCNTVNMLLCTVICYYAQNTKYAIYVQYTKYAVQAQYTKIGYLCTIHYAVYA